MYLLAQRRISVGEVIPAGIGGGLIGLLITLPLDSFFWLRFPLWPELAGLWFNVVEGKSTEWGTSPWWFYFINAIPRLLMNPLAWQVCIPMALGVSATRRASLDIAVPLMIFVAIYSVQPHKEWRFILYVVPGLTTVAGLGANWIWTRRAKSFAYRVLALALIASSLASFGASLGMLAISRLNYPGADALVAVHELARNSSTQPVVRIHMDTLACTTGVTRFLQLSSDAKKESDPPIVWAYDKTEDADVLLTPAFWTQFDYVLAERPETVIGKWDVVREIRAFSGLSIAKGKGEEGEERSEEEAGEQSEKGMDWVMTSVKNFLVRKVTRGWWVDIRMEPKIYVLKST